MKLMIASDIHGSLYWCGEMLNAFAREGADRLILLGDLLYHGPRNDLPRSYDPKGVTAALNGAKNHLLCVRGNCDADVDQMVLEFPITAQSLLLYADGLTIFATHGDVFSPDAPPLIKPGEILLSGHTHVQALKKVGSFYTFNPGSVSLPKEGTENSYMLYEDKTFTVKNFSGHALLARTL